MRRPLHDAGDAALHIGDQFGPAFVCFGIAIARIGGHERKTLADRPFGEADPAQGDISFDADGTYAAKITADAHADGLVFTGTGFTGVIDSVTLINCPLINVRGSLFR